MTILIMTEIMLEFLFVNALSAAKSAKENILPTTSQDNFYFKLVR